MRSNTKGPKIDSIAVPPSNVCQNLEQLFEIGKGKDVNFEVDGETTHSEGHSSGPSQRDNEGSSGSCGARSSWRDNGGGSRSRGTRFSRRRTSTWSHRRISSSHQRTQCPSTPSNEDKKGQSLAFLFLFMFMFFLFLFLFFCLFVFLFSGSDGGGV